MDNWEIEWFNAVFNGALISKPRTWFYFSYLRKMFWIDGVSPQKIEQANMDGSARAVLVSTGLVWASSLALDYSNRLLYWCDSTLQKIERVDLRGNNRTVILDLSSDDWHPFGLALSDSVIYWSDREKKSINKYNISSSLNEVLVHGIGSPKKLHIHDITEVFSGVLFNQFLRYSTPYPFKLCLHQFHYRRFKKNIEIPLMS